MRRDPLLKGRSRCELDDAFLASHAVSESQDARGWSVSFPRKIHDLRSRGVFIIGRSALPAGGGVGGCHTATSSMRLAAAVAAARLSRNRSRAGGISRSSHSSRELFQARSRAELMVQLATRLPTACRW